jgi:Co/Zn/Cd efflux system component
MIEFIPHIDPETGKEINTWLKYIDPLLTLIMVVVIAIRAFPVIFSISQILIENVPGGIDTQNLMTEIVTAVPAIKSIHSFHIWRYKKQTNELIFSKNLSGFILEPPLKKSMLHYIWYVMKMFC